MTEYFRTVSLQKEEDIDPSFTSLQESRKGKQDIGNQAVWSLSSAKQGFGVDQLRDNSLETWWQSDGSQPHFINIQFYKRVTLSEVCIYADYKQDESYTPQKISIRAGTTFHDLKEIKQIEVSAEEGGWIPIDLYHPNDSTEPLRTNFLQLAIICNHQNGRDTHVRQVKVFSPIQHASAVERGPEFTSECEQNWLEKDEEPCGDLQIDDKHTHLAILVVNGKKGRL